MKTRNNKRRKTNPLVRINHTYGLCGLLLLMALRSLLYLAGNRYRTPPPELVASFLQWDRAQQEGPYSVRPDSTLKALFTLTRSQSARIELNTADSLELLKIKGVGAYYAHQILERRAQLGGFMVPEQLLELPGMDLERYEKLSNQVFVDPSYARCIDLRTAPLEQLSAHPYIGRYTAHNIVRFRKLMGPDSCTLQALCREKIVQKEQADKLVLYICGLN